MYVITGEEISIPEMSFCHPYKYAWPLAADVIRYETLHPQRQGFCLVADFSA